MTQYEMFFKKLFSAMIFEFIKNEPEFLEPQIEYEFFVVADILKTQVEEAENKKDETAYDKI